MAKPGFLVSFAGVGTQHVPVHRVRDFAEDLQREVERQAWGTVENPDTARDTVEVTAATFRALGNVAGAINRSLRRQRLLESAMVTRRVPPQEEP